MLALRSLPFLKTVALKFAYYALGGIPVLFLILGQEHLLYSFFASGFAFIATHFLRREVRKLQPVHERNLTEYVAIGLTVALWATMAFSRFYGLAI